MNSVILISEEPINLAAVANAFEATGRVDLQSDRLVVEGDWGWFALDPDVGIPADFDDAELAQLRRFIPAPVFTALSYRDPRGADLVIALLPGSGTILIDNDHGLLATIEEIRRRIRAGSRWHDAVS